jgi:hypothetical protein
MADTAAGVLLRPSLISAINWASLILEQEVLDLLQGIVREWCPRCQTGTGRAKASGRRDEHFAGSRRFGYSHRWRSRRGTLPVRWR